MRVAKLREGAKIPTKNHPDDAGWDLYSFGEYYIPGSNFRSIPTGVTIDIPRGIVGLIKPKGRSNYLIGAGVVDSGYQVVRFDYRGTGLSDWIEDWQQKPYSLSDLAKDAKTILDTLKISKAHLIGLSLGGMVAQEFALENADRTLTLTSIMSSGNIEDQELPKISFSILYNLTKVAIKYGIFQSEKNTIKLIIAVKVILRGDATYDIDVKGTAEQVLYNLRKRKGYNPNVSGQHDEAAKLSGSRYDKLKDLKIPVLILHGINDPLISIEHSRKLASAIPNSRTKWYYNMGHFLPLNLIDPIIQEIIINIKMKTEK